MPATTTSSASMVHDKVPRPVWYYVLGDVSEFACGVWLLAARNVVLCHHLFS